MQATLAKNEQYQLNKSGYIRAIQLNKLIYNN